jgi:hypothetical protein
MFIVPNSWPGYGISEENNDLIADLGEVWAWN